MGIHVYTVFCAKAAAYLEVVAMIAWALLLSGYWWYTTANGLAPMQTMQILIHFISDSLYGFPIYVAVYMIRPVFLFPATLVTMTATYLYGPVQGIAYALVASNPSSMIAYFIGRFFRKRISPQHRTKQNGQHPR